MANLETRRPARLRRPAWLVVVTLSCAALLVPTATALADSGNPTGISATLSGTTVTVQGTWKWPDCPGKLIVGWAVAWGEPGWTGNPIVGGSQTYYMSDGAQNNLVSTNVPPADCTSSTGSWGPLSHTYAGPGTYHVCVVIYDVHASDWYSTIGHSRIAGGPNRNLDNSIEENTTKVGSCEGVTVVVPAGTAPAAPASTPTPTPAPTPAATPAASPTPVPESAVAGVTGTPSNEVLPATETLPKAAAAPLIDSGSQLVLLAGAGVLGLALTLVLSAAVGKRRKR